MIKTRFFLLCIASSLLLLAIHSAPLAAQIDGHGAEADVNALTVQRVSSEPDFDERLGSVRWSPDGERFAWIETSSHTGSIRINDKSPQREIWSVSTQGRVQPKTESGSQSTVSSAHSSADRILLVSAAKVTSSLSGFETPTHPKLEDDDQKSNPYILRDFEWTPDHNSLLLVGLRSIALLELATGKSRLLVSGHETLTDASISPDGRTVSFVREHALWIAPLHGELHQLIAPRARTDMSVGEPDWAYRNEFHMSRAYWWSPDSSRVAWLETDDRSVSKYTLRSSNGESRQIAYPKPGGALPIVHVFVQRAAKGSPLQIDLGSTKDFYLPFVTWLPDGRHLAIQRLDRFQHSLDLILADTLTGKTTTLLTERDKYWINFSDILYFFKDSKYFLWSSERTGFRHLYLYDIQGKQISQISRGNWEVTQLNAIDEATSNVYFTATEASPLERHLYKIKLDGDRPSRITQQPGTHQVSFSPKLGQYIDDFSSQETPPRLFLARIDGISQVQLDAETEGSNHWPTKQIDQRISHHDSPGAATGTAENAASSGALKAQPNSLQPRLEAVDFIPLKLHLGAETQAFLIRPPDFHPTKKYPVIVYLAGGPGEQLVRNAWGGATGLWMQLMAQNGYIVFALDNQGTSGRGHYFEEPIHLRLAAQELADQRDGLSYLSTLPYVDMARLGVCGWGYGGFLVVHAMLDRPVPFKAGFAGAPITDWHYYDAVFSERYLDDSVAHADGWAASTAFENDNPRFFKGALMVAQGSEDEFVHLENALTLQDQLLDAGKSASILLLANRGHAIVDPPSRLVLFKQMTDFFLENL
jgi:dipeptidyl-peptidase-4